MDIKYNLFGTEWTIKSVPSLEPDNTDIVYRGHTSPDSYEIQIAEKSSRGVVFTEKDRELTKLHEIVHSIFMTGQYNGSNEDEPLVEWVARCIYSLKKQNVL